MYHFTRQDLTAQQQYKFISGSIIPRPIAWVTTLAGAVVNLAPFSFFSSVPGNEPLMTLAIGRKSAQQPKDTAANLLATGEAVVHIVSADLVAQMNATAATLPADKSEATAAQLELVPSHTVAVPGLAAAKIRFETSLYQHVLIKDSADQPMADLFVLRVSDFYFATDVFDAERQYILPSALQPVARLAGTEYAELGPTYRLVRPR
ncbi:flavin reductase family protein [Loigolactobacillus zhaoyuanensis]|uniref:Flavin reductase family protein n=1 Tax=Loigolactobacillus zhaoyuanensis TaxID=2486017 RepID=A0ABW8UC38_9LACO|nr:flavin reductase family protein [Loigolactobacillus zhaoyuanensis]